MMEKAMVEGKIGLKFFSIPGNEQHEFIQPMNTQSGREIMKNIKKAMVAFFAGLLIIGCLSSLAQSPRVYWDFETIKNGKVLEVINRKWDVLEGNYGPAPGIKGQGLRLDGFTALLRSGETKLPELNKELTVELWLALGEYPWNWCPALTTEEGNVRGYRLEIGPYGQVAMTVCIDEKWVSAVTESNVVPLRKWTHIAGLYKANGTIEVYVNGVRSAVSMIKGEMKKSGGNFLAGMVASPGKPSDIHRTFGTLEDFYGIDGIFDEIKIYDLALTADRIKTNHREHKIVAPEIQPRRLPAIEKNPRKFGAFYATLKYYPGWDNLWPVREHADVVVTFDNSEVKMIFWRGTRYSPAWVSENDLWMADQSVEAWNDEEGCFEHMQDRHCRFSHVRIIENNEARVVVHWRYAPVSINENTWRRDPKTGWECWVDEYYYIYPDRTAIRNVSWKKGTLEFPRQFQESLVLVHPEQRACEVVDKDFASVADYDGRMNKVSFVEDVSQPPYGPFSWDKYHDYTVQQYNFKAKNKPFICFEPDNKMWLRYESLKNYCGVRGCNHWPVGQARCDGRTTIVADRPSHIIGFPISEPVVHEQGDREYWAGLYGMNEMKIEEVVKFGRTWAYPAEIVVDDNDFKNYGYDRGQRCYILKNINQKPTGRKIRLEASGQSPVINPAILVEGWNGAAARVLVDGRELEGVRVGINRTLEGSDLIVFIPITSESAVEITLLY